MDENAIENLIDTSDVDGDFADAELPEHKVAQFAALRRAYLNKIQAQNGMPAADVQGNVYFCII